MKIYNTLTRQKEEFKTIEENKVKMYVCGPTVYNYIHVGNARPLVFFDTVRRYLEFRNYDVQFVMNITDIDDKIINRAIEENVDFTEISKKYTKEFLDNARSLNVDLDKITQSKATDYIYKMVEFIKGLEEKKSAYDTENTVYFNVESAKNYGKLSKKNIEELNAGNRVNVDKNKKNPLDFALWKKQKNENEPAWNSPWGKGRPGWHIECSTMANELLGETIDIHGGGEDLQFPHHENEIAQSETLHDKPFANYWMHNSMITVDKEKMSKSLGNFFTIHDIEKEYDLMIVRMWLISGHYRTPLDFSKENLNAIKNGYDRLENAYRNLERNITYSKNNSSRNEEMISKIDKFVDSFVSAMDDDFNTSNALTSIYELARFINSNFSLESSKEDMKYAKEIFDKLLNVLGIKFKEEELDDEIKNLIEERTLARKEKNFSKADEIRDKLYDLGIEVKDTPNGVVWKKI